MKKVILRILSYVLDTIFISLIVYLVAQVGFINPKKEEVADLNQSYIDVYSQYLELTNGDDSKFDGYLEDKLLDEGEIAEIAEKYPEFKDFCYLDGYEALSEIDKDVEANMSNYIDDTMTDYMEHYSYEVAKASKYQTIISIVVTILYFGLLQWLLKGQTLFKKIFRLRVVSTKEDKKVSLFKYLLRAILMAELIFVVGDLVCALTMKQGLYVKSSSWITEGRYIYELAFLVVMIFRDDARSIHDLLLGTNVVRYDKQGNIIDEHLFNVEDTTNKSEVIASEVEEKKDNKKEDKKETKKSSTTKKKTTTKKKEKDFVEAEKIDD